MPESPISDDVRRFLSAHIRSVTELEILLLLSASQDKSWSPAQVYSSLPTNEPFIRQTLDRFCKEGLAARTDSPPGYRFSPTSEAAAKLIASLHDLYRELPVRIVQAIYEAPVSDIEEFARAFRIRKDTKDT